MYYFRENLRSNLPLVLLIFCGLNSLVYVMYFFQFLKYDINIFLSLGYLVEIVGTMGIGLYMYFFKGKQDWMINNISYFFICYFTLTIYNRVIVQYLFSYKHGGFQFISFFGIVYLLIPLVFVILIYEKGILSNLFSKRGHIIDRIFFSYIFIYIFAYTLLQGFQLWYFYKNLEGFGSMYNGLDQSIIMLILFSLIFMVNIIVKPTLFLTRSLNLGLIVFVFVILVGMDYLRYISSLTNFFSEDDPFSLIGFLTSLSLGGYGLVFIFYVIVKLISWKSTKEYIVESELLV